MLRFSIYFYLRCLAFCGVLAWATPQLGLAQGASSDSFIASWRLLNQEQKQYFISGYLRGLSDAAKVTDVAIEFIRQNPQTAIQSLTELKKVYDLSYLSPAQVAREVDKYYADPANKEKSLSQAVTASRLR
jgi:hypothetical protein